MAGSGFFVHSSVARRQHGAVQPMSRSLDSHRARGRRLVLRYAAVQAVCAVAAALAIGVAQGLLALKAALVGGMVVTLGNVLFGWVLFQPGVAPARTLSRAAYVGEALKWVWVGVALWLALGVAEEPPLPLLLGLIAAQIGFWVAVARIH